MLTASVAIITNRSGLYQGCPERRQPARRLRSEVLLLSAPQPRKERLEDTAPAWQVGPGRLIV